MSTAEQIIVDHMPVVVNAGGKYVFACGACCRTYPDREAFAAHVVAALTNAGKTIVDLPEADETGNYMPGYGRTRICIEGDSIASGRATDGFMASYTSHSVEHLDAYVGALLAAKRDLLAAARVAEGGERGEL